MFRRHFAREEAETAAQILRGVQGEGAAGRIRLEAQPAVLLKEAMVVGALPPAALRALAAQGVTPASAAVSIARRDLAHLTRRPKVERGQALAEADVDRLPEVLAAPEATLYEPPRTPGARGTLLMVFTPAGAEERRRGKWVVQIDERRGRGRRRPYQTNSVRTAGYVQAGDLRDPRYVLLEGTVEG